MSADYLLPDERAFVDVRRHWAVLLPRAGKYAALALLFLWLAARGRPSGPVRGMATFGLLIAGGRLAWAILEWRLDRFVVTDKRVLLITGLLTHRVAMMPLKKVTDMTYERDVLGRLLGYGAFVIESAGQDQALHRVDHLPMPDEVAHSVFSLLFGTQPVPSAYDDEDDRDLGSDGEEGGGSGGLDGGSWWTPPPTHGSVRLGGD